MPSTSIQCDKEALVKGYIKQYNTEEFTLDNAFLHQVFIIGQKKLILNESSLLSKYRNELAQYLERRHLDSTEYQKYRFNPKRFSYDVYGTTELWFMILHANELYTINQFDLTDVWYYNPGVFQVVTRALDLEMPFTNLNESEVDAMLRTNLSESE